MSNVSKGKQYEREAEKILQSQGYLTERAFNKTVWIRPGVVRSIAHDFFGHFDIIAKKAGSPAVWVQVSTWEQSSVKRAKLLDLEAFGNGDDVQIWARVRGKGGHFRILRVRDRYVWIGEMVEVIK